MGFSNIFKVPISNKKNSDGGYSVWKGELVEDVETGESESLLRHVFSYLGYIDYVMFDPSHGTNLNLDLNENSLAVKFGLEIRMRKTEMEEISSRSDLGLVYAGGIKPNNLKKMVGKITKLFPRRI